MFPRADLLEKNEKSHQIFNTASSTRTKESASQQESQITCTQWPPLSRTNPSPTNKNRPFAASTMTANHCHRPPTKQQYRRENPNSTTKTPRISLFLTVLLVLPLLLPSSSMSFTVLAPSITSPNTTCLSSSQGVYSRVKQKQQSHNRKCSTSRTAI